jgi:hypothetical protein
MAHTPPDQQEIIQPSPQRVSLPRGRLKNKTAHVLDYHKWGAAGVSGTEAREAAKPPAVTRMALSTEYPF